LVTSKISPERLRFLSCDHVIPDENLLGLIADLGPSGQEFEFSYDQRKNSKMINELGLMVTNLCTVVPDGVVIFFPSYAYEEVVMDHWKASGVLERIGAKKKVFREPRNTSSIDETLQNYAQHIEKSSPGGALLSAVVGGKMSEGINFKDELGRCVIMVGLPFPNARDPVLLEKMAFVNHKAVGDGGSKTKDAASEYESNFHFLNFF
jgi:chromosome transmission fidelity protein 1